MAGRRIAGLALVMSMVIAHNGNAQDILPSRTPFHPVAHKQGVSPWLTSVAVACQVLDLVTTEVAIHNGLQEGNPLMKSRTVRVTWKLAMPVLGSRALKSTPRAQANSKGMVWAIAGCVPAAVNSVLSLRAGKR